MGILRNVWIFAGEDVTNNSDTQQPAPLWPPGQGDANTPVTRTDVWSSDGTDCASERLDSEEAGAPIGETARGERGDERDGLGLVVKQGWKKI